MTIVVVSPVILYYPLNFPSTVCLSRSLFLVGLGHLTSYYFTFHNRRCRPIRNLAAPTLIIFPPPTLE